MDGRQERPVPLCEGGEAIERPGANELLRVVEVPAEDLHCAATLSRGPAQEWQGANDLQSHLPLLAVGERPDEEAPVRLDPPSVLAGDLLEEVERPHGDEPVAVLRELRNLGDSPGIRQRVGERPLGQGQGAAIAAGEEAP